MAWLSGWNYRKSVILSRASGQVTNYQMKLLVGESSGATGEDVDCDGHCLSTFNDLRFTTSDGSTLLDYWIESVSGTTPNGLATVWIEFDSIGTGDTTFYMYYGKADAAAASDGASTFINFVDNGGTPDTDGWSSVDYRAGDVALRVRAMIPDTIADYSGVSFSTATRAYIRLQRKDASANQSSWQNYDGAGYRDWSTTALGFNSIHIYELGRIASGTAKALGWVDGVSAGTDTARVPTADVKIQVSANVQLYWAFIRNYRETEPVWGSWGSEEEYIVSEYNVLVDSSLEGAYSDILLGSIAPKNVLISSLLEGVSSDILLEIIPEYDVIIGSTLEGVFGDILLTQVEKFERIKIIFEARANTFDDIPLVVQWQKGRYEELAVLFEVLKAGSYDFDDIPIVFEAVWGDRYENIPIMFSIIRQVQEFSSYIMMKLYLTCSELTDFGDLKLLDWNVKPNRTWYVRVTDGFVVLYYTLADMENDTNPVACGSADSDLHVVLTVPAKYESGLYDGAYIRFSDYYEDQPLNTSQTLWAWDSAAQEEIPEGTEFVWTLDGPGALNVTGWTDVNVTVEGTSAVYSTPKTGSYQNAIIRLYCNGVLIDTKVINGTEDVKDEYDPEVEEVIDFYYQDLPYHLSLSTLLIGDEYEGETRCFRVNPMTDISEIRDPIYNNSNLVLIRGEAELNLHSQCCLNKEIVLGTHLPTLEVGEFVEYASDRRDYTEKSQVMGHTINGNPDSLITVVRTATYIELSRRASTRAIVGPVIKPTETPTVIPDPTTTTTTTAPTTTPPPTTTGTGTPTPTVTPTPTTTSGIKQVIVRPAGDYSCQCYLWNSSTHYGAVNTDYAFTNHSTVGVNRCIYAPTTNPVPPAEQQILRDLFYMSNPGLSNVTVTSVTACGFGANWHSDQMILFHIMTTQGLLTSPNRGTWNWVNVSYTWYNVEFPNINSIIAGVTLASVRESDYQPPETLEDGPLAQFYLIINYIQN